jgi:acetylornithine/succinyldiaminopimelate/putrescine aminotransferase
METIPSTATFTIPPDDWYPLLRALCDERGTLMILGEVQAGSEATGGSGHTKEWALSPTSWCVAGGRDTGRLQDRSPITSHFGAGPQRAYSGR